MAVAIGAGLPVAEPTGSMVLDIGGGTSEIGVMSLGGTVYSTSLRVAGDTFDDAIISHVRRKHGVLIGDATSERVKKAIAAAWDKSECKEMEVKGRDIAEGLSRAITLTSDEIYEALSDPLEAIVQAIKSTLEQTPPELSADIGDKGLVIAGGGALMRDMARRLMEDTGLPVVIADDPLTCVVRGCGKALEDMNHLRDIFSYE